MTYENDMKKCTACGEPLLHQPMTISYGYIGPSGPVNMETNRYCPHCFYEIHGAAFKKIGELRSLNAE